MHTMAMQLVRAGLVEPDRAAMADNAVALSRECGRNERAALKRVNQDHLARAAEIRRMREESKRRWQENGRIVAPEAAPVRDPQAVDYSPMRRYEVGQKVYHPGLRGGQVLAVARRRVTVLFETGQIDLVVT